MNIFKSIIDSVTPNNREQWLPIIQMTYPGSVNFPRSKIVVCDLHFDAKYIINIGPRKRLTVDAVPAIPNGPNVPEIRYQISDISMISMVS